MFLIPGKSWEQNDLAISMALTIPVPNPLSKNRIWRCLAFTSRLVEKRNNKNQNKFVLNYFEKYVVWKCKLVEKRPHLAIYKTWKKKRKKLGKDLGFQLFECELCRFYEFCWGFYFRRQFLRFCMRRGVIIEVSCLPKLFS